MQHALQGFYCSTRVARSEHVDQHCHTVKSSISDLRDYQCNVNRNNDVSDESRQEACFREDMTNQPIQEEATSSQAGVAVSTSSTPFLSDLMGLLNDSHEVSLQARLNTDVDQNEGNFKSTGVFRPSTCPAPVLTDLLSGSFDDKSAQTSSAAKTISPDAADSGEGISTTLHSTAHDEGQL